MLELSRQVIASVPNSEVITLLISLISRTMTDFKESHSDCAPIPPDVKEVLEKGDEFLLVKSQD